MKTVRNAANCSRTLRKTCSHSDQSTCRGGRSADARRSFSSVPFLLLPPSLPLPPAAAAATPHASVGLDCQRVTGAPLHRHVRGHAERHAEAHGELEGSAAGHPRHGPLLHCEWPTAPGHVSCFNFSIQCVYHLLFLGFFSALSSHKGFKSCKMEKCCFFSGLLASLTYIYLYIVSSKKINLINYIMYN